jgi:predicted Zn-dependent peptidase
MNEKPQTITLSNGLTCLFAPVAGLQSITVLGLVKAGTRYETPVNNGISHFLEHMVFKGTQKYEKAMDISAAVDEVGGVLNAFTDKEHTGYYVKSAVESADTAFDVVSQLMFYPTIPEAELEIERGVILEEINMYEDQPQNKVIREFLTLSFSRAHLVGIHWGKVILSAILSARIFLSITSTSTPLTVWSWL